MSGGEELDVVNVNQESASVATIGDQLLPFTIIFAIIITLVELLDLPPKLTGVFPRFPIYGELQSDAEPAAASDGDAPLQYEVAFEEANITQTDSGTLGLPNESSLNGVNQSFLFHSLGHVTPIDVLDLEEEGNLERAARARSYQVMVDTDSEM
eukprot:5972625-Pyramimonas_sp.AAC.2